MQVRGVVSRVRAVLMNDTKTGDKLSSPLRWRSCSSQYVGNLTSRRLRMIKKGKETDNTGSIRGIWRTENRNWNSYVKQCLERAWASVWMVGTCGTRDR